MLANRCLIGVSLLLPRKGGIGHRRPVMATQKITITTVKKLAPEGGWLWDTDCAGFGARRQTRDVHFYLRYRLGRKAVHEADRSPGRALDTRDCPAAMLALGSGEVAQGQHPTFGNGHAQARARPSATLSPVSSIASVGSFDPRPSPNLPVTLRITLLPLRWDAPRGDRQADHRPTPRRNRNRKRRRYAESRPRLALVRSGIGPTVRP